MTEKPDHETLTELEKIEEERDAYRDALLSFSKSYAEILHLLNDSFLHLIGHRFTCQKGLVKRCVCLDCVKYRIHKFMEKSDMPVDMEDPEQ